MSRRIAAPSAVVYAAVCDPAKLKMWLGPSDFVTTEVEADVRPGGAFRFRMRRADGAYFGAEGIYREVVPGARVALTWRWNEGPDDEDQPTGETLLMIEVEPTGRETIVTITHELLPSENLARSHRQGWSQSLAKLGEIFER